MERIASFQVDHDKLMPGLYLSRRDGEVTTFDLRFKKPNTGDLLTNAEIEQLAEARTAAKKAKNFAEADRIRAEILEKGYVIEDTPQGPKVKKA